MIRVNTPRWAGFAIQPNSRSFPVKLKWSCMLHLSIIVRITSLNIRPVGEYKFFININSQ